MRSILLCMSTLNFFFLCFFSFFSLFFFFFFKQKTAYEIGLGIPAEPLFRSVGALRLSPLRRGLAIDSTVDIFTFYVPHRHVYGEQWIKFMKDGVNATPLPTVNTTGYIDHAAFLGTINPDTNKIPKHLFQG